MTSRELTPELSALSGGSLARTARGRRGWRLGAGTAAALAVLGAGGVAGASSGNGVQNKSASQIAQSASAAMQQAQSFTLSGSVKQGNQTISLRGIRMSNSGYAVGSLSVNGASVDVVKTPSQVYFRGGQAFWQKAGASPSGAKLLDGKWVYAPANDASLAKFVALVTPRAITSQFNITSATGAKKGKISTVNGSRTISVYQTRGRTTGTLYVLTTGKPYITRITATGSTTPVNLNFTNFNQPVRPTVPQGGINITQLSGGGSTPTS